MKQLSPFTRACWGEDRPVLRLARLVHRMLFLQLWWPPGILYGLFTLDHCPVSKEICHATDIIMCPICYTSFRQWGDCFFAGFMAVGVEAKYSKKERMNPISGSLSLTKPSLTNTVARRLSFWNLLMVSVNMLVIATVFGIVIYRVITVSTFAAFGWALIRNNSQVATTGTAVCINFCMIMLLNVLYEKRSVCLILSVHVMFHISVSVRPRAAEDRIRVGDSFTLKMFLFQFVNLNSSTFYIAFFWEDSQADPVNIYASSIAGNGRNGDHHGAKTDWNNFMEIGYPLIQNWWTRRRLRREYGQKAKASFPHLTVCSPPSLWQPSSGSLLALLNNIIEIRLDAYNMGHVLVRAEQGRCMMGTSMPVSQFSGADFEKRSQPSTNGSKLFGEAVKYCSYRDTGSLRFS
ncbi:hypothetical protein INR49_009479 [Caranx melampygus]|nr:hypothetical protein INR49_009479 [Caranx melampygus]